MFSTCRFHTPSIGSCCECEFDRKKKGLVCGGCRYLGCGWCDIPDNQHLRIADGTLIEDETGTWWFKYTHNDEDYKIFLDAIHPKQSCDEIVTAQIVNFCIYWQMPVAYLPFKEE